MNAKPASARPKAKTGTPRPKSGTPQPKAAPARPPRDRDAPWPVGRTPTQIAAVGIGVLLLGGLVGVASGFAHAQRAGDLRIGVPVTIATQAALVVVAGVLTRSRVAAGLTALGWLISVLVFAQPKSEGDLVIAGDGPGIAYLIGGLVIIGGLSTLPFHRVSDRPGATERVTRPARPAGRG